MPFRIAVGLIFQESNSFSPIPTVLETFEQCLLLRGEEILGSQFRGISVDLPGFLSVLKEAGAIPVPLIATEALAAGPLTRATFDTLVGERGVNRDRCGLRAVTDRVFQQVRKHPAGEHDVNVDWRQVIGNLNGENLTTPARGQIVDHACHQVGK